MYRQRMCDNECLITDRIKSVPIVSSTLGQMTDYYERARHCNSLLHVYFSAVEKGVAIAINIAMPFATPLCNTFDHQLKILNNIACVQLDIIEKKFPIIMKPTDEVLKTTMETCNTAIQPVKQCINAVQSYKDGAISSVKNYGCETVASTTERCQRAARQLNDHVLGNPVTKYALQKIDNSVDYIDDCTDKYLPVQTAAGEDDKVEKEELLTRKMLHVTRKLARRLTRRSSLRNDKVKDTVQTTYNNAVELTHNVTDLTAAAAKSATLAGYNLAKSATLNSFDLARSATVKSYQLARTVTIASCDLAVSATSTSYDLSRLATLASYELLWSATSASYDLTRSLAYNSYDRVKSVTLNGYALAKSAALNSYDHVKFVTLDRLNHALIAAKTMPLGLASNMHYFLNSLDDNMDKYFNDEIQGENKLSANNEAGLVVKIFYIGNKVFVRASNRCKVLISNSKNGSNKILSQQVEKVVNYATTGKEIALDFWREINMDEKQAANFYSQITCMDQASTYSRSVSTIRHLKHMGIDIYVKLVGPFFSLASFVLPPSVFFGEYNQEKRGQPSVNSKNQMLDKATNTVATATDIETYFQLHNIAADAKASATESSPTTKRKKEKSTDCDSALIPLHCVHG